MEIQLHNIGVIQDASIKLDGLTVITGKNETGKTTVGKALYALIDAVSDLPEKAKMDRNAYLKNCLFNLVDRSNLFLSFRMRSDRETYNSDENNMLVDYPALLNLSIRSRFHKILESNTDLEKFAREVEKDLIAYQQHLNSDEDKVKRDLAVRNYAYQIILAQNSQKGESSAVTEKTIDSLISSGVRAMNNQISSHIQDLEKMLVAVNQDPELIHYAKESIRQTLNAEFSDQIQPINDTGKQSAIQLTDEENVYFDIAIRRNRVANDNVFFHSPFKDVYMVDDPFILDSLSSFVEYAHSWEGDNLLNTLSIRSSVDKEGFLRPTEIKNHRDRLSDLLHDLPHISVLEQTILNTTLRPVTEKMDQVLPGTFNFEEEYYIREDGTKLRISNLAAGSKMFSIVKLLLEHGLLNEDTLLILDEPETYLHPEWQNQFAEIIVLLVKELRVKVLLTTHSSNFMLAIDAYMRKYEINDVSNFYHTRQLENGFVVHDCVNDNMEEIYGDFLDYLSEAKVLRDRYLTDDEEEIW